MAEKYILRVTAGPSYDASTHSEVAVNGSESTVIRGARCTARIRVRIRDYRGLPRGSPSTSTYFSHPPHQHDQYSIAFSMVPHQTISGADLVFGNDFDRPIRDKLPPGFSMAMGIVKRLIDPGLDGDAYADKPYLYGPLLSSINLLSVDGKLTPKGSGGEQSEYEIPADASEDGITEGAQGEDGENARSESCLPSDAGYRKSWALKEENREGFEWEQGRLYRGDFFNPYIDFNDFSLKLPGFSISVVRLLDGNDNLRYTLKDKKTGDVFFVVVFTLLRTEDVEKAEAEQKAKAGKTDGAQSKSTNDDDVD